MGKNCDVALRNTLDEALIQRAEPTLGIPFHPAWSRGRPRAARPPEGPRKAELAVPRAQAESEVPSYARENICLFSQLRTSLHEYSEESTGQESQC